jgi:hypothetical protein
MGSLLLGRCVLRLLRLRRCEAATGTAALAVSTFESEVCRECVLSMDMVSSHRIHECSTCASAWRWACGQDLCALGEHLCGCLLCIGRVDDTLYVWHTILGDGRFLAGAHMPCAHHLRRDKRLPAGLAVRGLEDRTPAQSARAPGRPTLGTPSYIR